MTLPSILRTVCAGEVGPAGRSLDHLADVVGGSAPRAGRANRHLGQGRDSRRCDLREAGPAHRLTPLTR